jgi:hypothetical protein
MFFFPKEDNYVESGYVSNVGFVDYYICYQEDRLTHEPIPQLLAVHLEGPFTSSDSLMKQILSAARQQNITHQNIIQMPVRSLI